MIYSWANPRPPQKSPEMGPSVVVPDQTMDVRTLMERHARGMPLDVKVRNPQWYNGEFPDIQKMDISEIAAMKRKVAEDVQNMKKELNKQEEFRKLQELQKYKDQIADLEKRLNKEQQKDSKFTKDEK